MPFVNEIIPEEEKQKFNFPIQTFQSGSRPTLWKWIIDHDRKIFLLHTHSYGEGSQKIEHHILSWEGSLIECMAEKSSLGNKEKGRVLNWRIFNINIPAALENKTTEILELIREGFEVRDWPYRKEHFQTINIQIEKTIYFK